MRRCRCSNTEKNHSERSPNSLLGPGVVGGVHAVQATVHPGRVAYPRHRVAAHVVLADRVVAEHRLRHACLQRPAVDEISLCCTAISRAAEMLDASREHVQELECAGNHLGMIASAATGCQLLTAWRCIAKPCSLADYLPALNRWVEDLPVRAPVLPNKPHIPPRRKLRVAVDLHEVILAPIHARVQRAPQCGALRHGAVDAQELHVVPQAERQVPCSVCQLNVRARQPTAAEAPVGEL